MATRGAARHARVLRPAQAEHVRLRAEERSVPPCALARSLPGGRAEAARGARARGGSAWSRARLGDRAGALYLLLGRERVPRAHCESRAGARSRRPLVPAALRRHRAAAPLPRRPAALRRYGIPKRRRPRRLEQPLPERVPRGSAARGLPDGIRGQRAHAVPRHVRAAARPGDPRLLDRPRGRAAADLGRGSRGSCGGARPRARALGQLPGQRLRAGAPVPRAPARARGRPRRGTARGNRGQRDAAGPTVEARACDGRGVRVGSGSVRPRARVSSGRCASMGSRSWRAYARSRGLYLRARWRISAP